MAVAKAKKKLQRQEDDAEALKKFEERELKPRKKADVVRHRDSVSTNEVLNIMADEIEDIAHELGLNIDRLNAREYFAYNLWLALHVQGQVSAREKKVPMVKCSDHAG